MEQAYIVLGTVTEGRMIVLDEALPVPVGRRVRWIVEPLPTETMAMAAALAAIHERQRQRGHVPPTREQVDQYLQEERDSWDKE